MMQYFQQIMEKFFSYGLSKEGYFIMAVMFFMILFIGFIVFVILDKLQTRRLPEPIDSAAILRCIPLIVGWSIIWPLPLFMFGASLIIAIPLLLTGIVIRVVDSLLNRNNVSTT